MGEKPEKHDIAVGVLNFLGGVVDFADHLEKTKDPLRAAHKAIKKARKRKAALKAGIETFKSALESAKKLRRDETPADVISVCPFCKKRAVLHFDARDICSGCDKCQPEYAAKAQKKVASLFCPCGCGLPPSQCMGKSAGGTGGH